MRNIISNLLKKIGMKPIALAEKIGMPKNNLYDMLNGKKSMSIEKATEILAAVGARVHVVVEEPFDRELVDKTLLLAEYNEIWQIIFRQWLEANTLRASKKKCRGLPFYPTFSNYVNDVVAVSFTVSEQEDGLMASWSNALGSTTTMTVQVSEKKIYDTWGLKNDA